jgi:hypothetical protein
MAKEFPDFNASLLITGDPHAGDLSPECRNDDYLEAWCGKMQWVRKAQEHYKCSVVMPGDIFNHYQDIRAIAIKRHYSFLMMPSNSPNPRQRLIFCKA